MDKNCNTFFDNKLYYFAVSFAFFTQNTVTENCLRKSLIFNAKLVTTHICRRYYSGWMLRGSRSATWWLNFVLCCSCSVQRCIYTRTSVTKSSLVCRSALERNHFWTCPSFQSSCILAAVKISWWYLKRFKSYCIDKWTDTHTHKWTLLKTYHFRYANTARVINMHS